MLSLVGLCLIRPVWMLSPVGPCLIRPMWIGGCPKVEANGAKVLDKLSSMLSILKLRECS